MESVYLPIGDIYIPVLIEETKLFEGASQIILHIRPLWKTGDVQYKLFTDGITNKLIACFEKSDAENKNDVVLVRVYGNKTDLLIDRKAELRNIKLLNKSGLAPNVYAVFKNGIAYQYIPGVTLNIESVRDPKIWPLVAINMAKMHKVTLGEQFAQVPMIWDKIEQFLSLLPETFSNSDKNSRFISKFGSLTKLRLEYECLKLQLTKVGGDIVFAHNDLLLGNVIYNKLDNKVSFIDFEYAAYNYQAFDIANHFSEFVGISNIDYKNYPNREFKKNWIRVYLSEYKSKPIDDLSNDDVNLLCDQVESFVLAAHFLWGIWSLIQMEYSHINFDFLGFAEVRLSEYFKLKNTALKFPS